MTWLARRDARLRRVVRAHGPPPLWARRPGFATLLRIVLEQQVTLASGRAVYRRLAAALGAVRAEGVLQLGVAGMRRLGLTRQKAAYCVGLATAVTAGALDLGRVARLPVADARLALQAVKGIGPWTADVYLLMALRRPDVWPAGDLALLVAMQHARGLGTRPTSGEASKYAERWTPWRAVAARILWHGYLAGTLRRST